jgi:hypothetical protein
MRMMRIWPITLAACLLAMACSKKDDAVENPLRQPMLGAVMHSRTDEVRRLAAQGIGLDERDPASNATPLITAGMTDQWPVAEILIDHGADIWAHDSFGITIGEPIDTSRILRGSEEDKARLRVIDKLKARGFPFPTPSSEEVLAMSKAGKWPPAGAR